MDVEAFVEDMENCQATQVGDITLTIGIKGDMMILEQPGDNPDPDTIMVFGKEDGRKIVEFLQAWLDAE
jgi:hypothetical protein